MGIRINEAYCKGCNLCVEICPNRVLEPSNKLNRKGVRIPLHSNSEKCTKCRLCEVICPDSAIYILEEDENNEGKG